MQPQEPMPPTPDPSQQISPPLSPHSHTKRNLIIIGGVVVVAAIVAVLAAYFFNTKPDNSAAMRARTDTTRASAPKAEQVLMNPADNSKVSIGQTDYYSITVGSTTYYGPILKVNDTYLRMTPTAYKSQDQLLFTGNELHGPESATFFTISNISEVRKLNESSAADATIINFVKPKVSQSSHEYPSGDIDTYLDYLRLQAFFFKDGMILFAKASNLQGNFLSSAKHVYYIASTNGQVSLTVAKPDQYAGRTSSELLYWQNLKSDGQVAKAIASYERSNPQFD